MIYGIAMKLTDPFSISPNPHFLFQTQNVKAILYQARSTIEKRQGLVTLLSPVGCGKTTILRYLWGELDANGDTTTCFIPTPNFPSVFAMVKTIAQTFKLEPERSLQAQLDSLHEFLAKEYYEGRNVCLLIDEGQILKDPFLEMLRSFLNFESNYAKLVQLVIAGQLEMWDRFKSKKNEPLRSRIHSYSMVNPLTDIEIAQMIQFRCDKVDFANPFTQKSVERIYELTKGVPRHVIKVCGKAIDYMKLSEEASVTREMIDAAAEDSAVEVAA